MSIAEVKGLPILEKFQIMEVIWEELSENLEDIEASDSEKKLLDKRLKRIETGESQVYDWDDVKNSLGNR